MLKKKKTTASGKLVLVKSVRRTRSHRMKFCVRRGLGALPSTSKQRGKSQRDFLLCGPVCINTAQKRYEDKIKKRKKAEIEAKKAAIRAEDIAKGVFVPVSSLPQREPMKGVQTA